MTPAPFGREVLMGFVPHAGSMCLLDGVSGYGPDDILCESATHRDSANPLRGPDGLSAVHLVEYAAQAVAVHGALLDEGRGLPGMLAAVRNFRMYVESLHDIPGLLTVRAHRRMARKEGLLYEFTVSGGGQMLGEGRITIVLG